MTYKKSSRLQSVGQLYNQFKLTKIVDIPELQCILRELVHEPTGAQVIHIGADDPENLFCLSFQTFPQSSNGVAHILEHTVLCGSQKFPVKDPFFTMNRRSLNTYMNALTGADFTCYPAASQVPKDFYNLLDVYLDAVFHPLLKEESFLQEGHRLEFANPSDPETPLEIKGIVYNEMKGAMSSPSARLSEAIHASLFPDITYGFNSGGDPKVIPELTYEELKQFHQTFYHPSQCLFFFYGNMPLDGHLDFIAKQTLDHTTRAPALAPIPPQPRFQKPIEKELFYPIGENEDINEKTFISFAWLTCHILEQEEALALNILEIILMDTDASLLKLALLKSGLCKQALSHMDIELAEIPWTITLKGCNPEQAEPLEELIRNTLKDICVKGIPLQLIENAIHQLEVYRSEIGGDHGPFGLSLFMRSALLKQHGANPEQGLMIHSLFDQVRQHTLANPRYFSELIQKYLLNNTHLVRLIMKPDKRIGFLESEVEKMLLEKIKHSITPDQTEQIIARAAELAHFQKEQEEEDFDILPRITLNEVPLSARDYPLIQEKVGELEVFHHNTFTNSIVYADLNFNLTELAEEDLPYLRLLTMVLTQVGSGDRDYRENLDYMQGNTGGIFAGINLNLQAKDHHHFFPSFYLKGKGLYRKAAKLFALMQDTVVSPHLNHLHRLKEIIDKHYVALEGRLNQNGLKYAINLSASALNLSSKVANDLYGIKYFVKLRDIVENWNHQGPYVLAKLQELQEKIMPVEHPHLVLSCTSAMYDELKSHGFYGLSEMQTNPYKPWKGDYQLEPVQAQGRVVASPVAFVSHVFPSLSYGHPKTPALGVMAYLFDNLTLHPRIREQGGAYGGGSASNAMSGNFYFYSYRDPNIASTLKAFNEAIQTLLKGDFEEFDLEEAKLEMIQGLDTPVSPGSRAEVAYGWWREGKTLDLRQKFRNKILDLTKKDIIEMVESVIEPNYKKGVPVVFASRELLEKENQALINEGMAPFKIEEI